MTRFEQTPTPTVYVAIALAMVAVCIADLVTSLGVAMWVWYLVPVVIAYFAWRPTVPLMVAGGATMMTVAGYYLSASGINPQVAGLNRFFGMTTGWTEY